MPMKPITLLLFLALAACADISYSDAPGSNIEVEDGEHWDDEKQDTPIIK
jgi:hypothetical protein